MKKIVSKIILLTCMVLLPQQVQTADFFRQACKSAVDYKYPLLAAVTTASFGGVAALGVAGFTVKAGLIGVSLGGAAGIGSYVLPTGVDKDDDQPMKESVFAGGCAVSGVLAGEFVVGGQVGSAAIGIPALAAGVATVKNAHDPEVGYTNAGVSLATGIAAAGIAGLKVPRANNRAVVVPAVLLMASSWMNGLWKTRAAEAIIRNLEKKYTVSSTRKWYDLYGHADAFVKGALNLGVRAEGANDKDRDFFGVVSSLMKNPLVAKDSQKALWNGDVNEFDKAFVGCRKQQHTVQSSHHGGTISRVDERNVPQVGAKMTGFLKWHNDHSGAAHVAEIPDFDDILKEYLDIVDTDLKKLCRLSSVSYKDVEGVDSLEGWKDFEKKLAGYWNCAGTAMMLGHMGYSAFHNHDRVKALILKLAKIRKCILQLQNIKAMLPGKPSIR